MNAIHDLPRRHSITVTEYVRMGEAQVFAHDARLELMQGEIVEMAPLGSAHAAVVCTLDTLLRELAPGAMVRVRRIRTTTCIRSRRMRCWLWRLLHWAELALSSQGCSLPS